MGALKFVCPVSDNEVDTGVDMDSDTFSGLSRGAVLPCPHCGDSHMLGNVKAWIEGEEDHE